MTSKRNTSDLFSNADSSAKTIKGLGKQKNSDKDKPALHLERYFTDAKLNPLGENSIHSTISS